MATLHAGAGFQVGFGLALGLTMANYMLYVYQPYGRTATQVLICLKCGGKNAIENKFCWNCGHPFYPLRVKCPKCGAMVTKEANFCENCGTKLKEKDEK